MNDERKGHQSSVTLLKNSTPVERVAEAGSSPTRCLVNSLSSFDSNAFIFHTLSLTLTRICYCLGALPFAFMLPSYKSSYLACTRTYRSSFSLL